jgi:hypothetical protein
MADRRRSSNWGIGQEASYCLRERLARYEMRPRASVLDESFAVARAIQIDISERYKIEECELDSAGSLRGSVAGFSSTRR